MSADDRFHRPKQYQPERAGQYSAEYLQHRGAPTNSLAASLGFDDEEEDVGADLGAQDEFRQRLTDLQEEVADLREKLKASELSDSKGQQKLASLQQINKSQTALVRNQMQESRKKLNKAKKSTVQLQKSLEWFERETGRKAPPPVAEDEDSDNCEGGEESAGTDLLSYEEIYERIKKEMQGDIQAPGSVAASASDAPASAAGGTSKPKKASSGTADDGASAELVAQLRKEVEDGKKKTRQVAQAYKKQQEELEDLRGKLQVAQSGGVAAAGASPSADEVARVTEALRAAEAKASSAEAKSSSVEAAAEKKEKEGMKKLKQLANAYQNLEKKHKELEGAHEELQQESTKKPAVDPQALLRPVLKRATGIQTQLRSQQQQITQLKADTRSEMQKFMENLPALLKGITDQAEKEIANATEVVNAKYLKEAEKRRKLHNLVQELRGNIRVYVRVRPLDKVREGESCVTFPAMEEIEIRNDSLNQKKSWEFDKVFDEASTQEQVFEEVRALVSSVLDGYNVCIFAYGQTGAGKTFSMEGTPENPGIYYRTFKELFDIIKERGVDYKYELTTALIEVYNEELHDLLLEPGKPAKKLAVRQGPSGNTVPDLTARVVRSTDEVTEALRFGSSNRAVGHTDMNAHSSRSHLIVQVQAAITMPGKNEPKIAKMNLIDLAGSERLTKSGAVGQAAKEAAFINKSLSALGDVINARATKQSHCPYRNSTLTYLLQDSLGGESKTLMLLQVSPSETNFDETSCSLTFGARVNAVEMKR